jgi:hypothetical protein
MDSGLALYDQQRALRAGAALEASRHAFEGNEAALHRSGWNSQRMHDGARGRGIAQVVLARDAQRDRERAGRGREV